MAGAWGQRAPREESGERRGSAAGGIRPDVVYTTAINTNTATTTANAGADANATTTATDTDTATITVTATA